MFRPVAMTIAGSDSGGGAGIQADLLTFSRLGAFGTTAITCVTAQNLSGVTSVAPLPPAEVRAQIEAILSGFPVRAVKTGMLFSREIIEAVADEAGRPEFPRLVVDPVMVATSGARLLREDAVSIYVARLFPHATVVTPNLDEAGVLLGRKVTGTGQMREAARELADRIGCPVFLKGGHLEGDQLLDVLWDGTEFHEWDGPRLAGVITHGTGCVLSAAVAARLAHGDLLAEACGAARAYVFSVLANPAELADGRLVPGLGVGGPL